MWQRRWFVGIFLLFFMNAVYYSILHRTDILFPRLAYVILAHDKETLDMASNLLYQIYRPEDFFFVHVDISCPELEISSFQNSWKGYSNFVVQSKLRGEWGNWSLVEMSILGLNYLKKIPDWDYVIFLSGDTYPLMPVKYIKRLTSFVGANILTIEGFTPENYRSAPKHKQMRFNNVSEDFNGRLLGTPQGLDIFFGTQWVTLTRDFALYVVGDDPIVQEWVEFFSKNEIPDESFFQTLAMNHPRFRTNHSMLSPFGLWSRYEKWYGGCLHDFSGSKRKYPCVFGPSDLPNLRRTPAMFARKFHSQLLDGYQLSEILYNFNESKFDALELMDLMDT
eukprot:TRINITY_DN13440_c0_g1_i1.p1 TRINITY_DN13440_c0_g1~~TRINITY_DN13440_c0_g1_i1.p1  ORF type:complete len:343 (-),score=42.51 TRINITY_DN13440_c0_g1_i1:169-1176(-)